MAKYQKDPTCGIFLKRGLIKDLKNDTPLCRTHKYRNTNTQIHKYSKWSSARKTQHVVYLWKEDCSRILKIIFPSVKRTKTSNTSKIKINKYSIWRSWLNRLLHCPKKVYLTHFLENSNGCQSGYIQQIRTKEQRANGLCGQVASTENAFLDNLFVLLMITSYIVECGISLLWSRIKTWARCNGNNFSPAFKAHSLVTSHCELCINGRQNHIMGYSR